MTIVFEKVSIIILNVYHLNDLKLCLESLKRITYPNYEIIIVDYSTPNITDFITTNYPEMRLIILSGRDIGPSAMHNLGIHNSNITAKYIAFLDTDTVVDKEWLTQLVLTIETDPKIAAVQSKLLLFDDSNILNSNGDLANYLAVGWSNGYGVIDTVSNVTKNISFASCAATLIRKNALLKIGLFDESYFIYADDLDVGLRFYLAGYRVCYCPQSVVYHKYHFLRSSRSYYYLNRNRIRTFLKLYSIKTYFMLIPSILLYELFANGYALVNGYYIQLLKAYLNTLTDLKQIIIKRFEAKRIKIISDCDLLIILKGGIDFSEISNLLLVRYLLNPFLEKNRQLMINFLTKFSS